MVLTIRGVFRSHNHNHKNEQGLFRCKNHSLKILGPSHSNG